MFIKSPDMGWSTGLIIFLFTCSYLQPGTPVLSKTALRQTKTMMKNVCKRNSGVSQDTLNELKSGVFLDDPKLKCYLHCCLGMMKTMKKDQITVADATKQIETLLPEEMRQNSLKQLNTCKDAVGADACDKAFNFIKCSFEVDPNNMLIPT